MSSVNEFLELAVAKLGKEQVDEGKKVNRYANVMAEPVAEALRSFCGQDKEFAQAVAQGGSFKDCMDKVSEKCGSALSDLEAYEGAVRFYFPGARVHFQMELDLVGDATRPDADGTEQSRGRKLLDLTDFL